jgi:glucokinase
MKSGDAAAAITQAALQEQEPLCVEALDLFVSILGAVAGNLALTALTVGGLYLGGGICPKIMPKLEDGSFMGAFTAKGRFRELLCTIPVRVILNEQAALLGAASWALDDSD